MGSINLFYKTGFLFLGIIILSSVRINAQQIVMNSIHIDNTNVVTITGKVTPKHSNREKYSISVYSSRDDFETPLNISYEQIDIREDHSFKITFEGNKVLKNLTGDTKFKVKAKAIEFPVHVEELPKHKAKRGSLIAFTWSDYHRHEAYDVLLIKDSLVVDTLAKKYTQTYLDWKTDEKFNPVGDYQLVVIPTSDPRMKSEPMSFKVTRKISLGLKFIGLGAAAGIWWFISNIENPTTPEPGPDGVVDPPGFPDI